MKKTKGQETRLRLASGGTVTRVQVGSNVVALQFSTQGTDRSLQRNHPLRGNALAEDPHRDLRLTNGLASQLRELGGDSDLSADSVDRLLHSLNTHMETNYNTASVINVNTRSANAFTHTYGMARNGEISDFWLRLSKARALQSPPVGMRQEDIASDWGVRQSAVTKWKTGKSLPQPELARDMAIRYEVMFDWLYTGRGDMRAPKATDPITLQVIEAMNDLKPDGRVEVLKAALTQQAMQIPAVAAQVEKARHTAEQMTKPHQHRRRSRAG